MLLYQFDVSENNFEVVDGDYIGWVNEDNNTWISASECVPARCQCSQSYYFWRSYNWPVPNRNSTFSCNGQYNFSVAVEIQPCTQVASLFIITLLITVSINQSIFVYFRHDKTRANRVLIVQNIKIVQSANM